jgi:hypothetical protein
LKYEPTLIVGEKEEIDMKAHIIAEVCTKENVDEAQAREVNSFWHDRKSNENATDYINRKHAELSEEDIRDLIKDGYSKEEIEEDKLCPCPANNKKVRGIN